MQELSEVTYSVQDRIATITLNRPHARNGYTVRMSEEIVDFLDQADADPNVSVVVLTGSGKHFCAGADLSGGSFEVDAELGTDSEWDEPAGRCSMRIFEMNTPVIAAVRGAAVGAGSTIILSADYRLASTDARFGFVFSRRGIYPEGASAWFLPRLVGMGRALDWMVSGRLLDSDEALASGLVHSVHEPDLLLDAAYALADDLVRNTAPVSVAVIRQMLYRLSGAALPYETQRVDSGLIAELASSADAAEGVSSFLEKRAPRFPGQVPGGIPQWLPWLQEHSR